MSKRLYSNTTKMNEFCAEKGFAGWFETSAKENIGLDEAATFLVNKVSFCYRVAKFLVIESTYAKISYLLARLPTTSCVRTACPKLSTSLEQVVNNL